MRDRTLMINMKNDDLSQSHIHDFFITMAICNTVVVSNAGDSGLVRGRGNEGVTREKVMALRYEAESPDEAALVEVQLNTSIHVQGVYCTYMYMYMYMYMYIHKL